VVEAVAESALDDPMIGSTRFRARRIVEGARKFGAEGVIISGISGASHCPFDESTIAAEVQKELDIPVLSFDVPYSPGRLNEQIVSRMQGFMDILQSKRDTVCSMAGPAIMRNEAASGDVPAEYFRNSMACEVDIVREAKRHGTGVVGIYCEFTPRELILAAGAVPVCLCGASSRTIPSAETVLPANLCPLIKSSFGYILTNRCPFYVVTDLIVAETTCDGKKKMYELIADKKPVHILELTQKVNEEEAYAHWLAEIQKLKDRLEEAFGNKITAERLNDAIRAMNMERSLLREAFLLGAEDPPAATGLELSDLRYRIAGQQGHIKMLRAFIDSARSRKEASAQRLHAGAPRFLLTGCPTAQGTTKVIELIEECGAVVVVQETCSGWKPLDIMIEENTEDPIEAIARKYFNLPCSCMTPNTGRRELLADLSVRFNAHAVVDLVWHACHTYNIESHLIEQFVSNDLGLPYLKIETDYSDSDRERIKVRVQTMVEMLQ
jgi:benzoyl-CoA reductase/2-hydroxyglutaryl-CoA dehydratase subunit BcrC/BadD/HgdB